MLAVAVSVVEIVAVPAETAATRFVGKVMRIVGRLKGALPGDRNQDLMGSLFK